MNLNSQSSRPDFNGAAVIDEHGREIPITEAMIQRACERLEKSWQYPGARASNSQKAG
ncbi:hypothetical protein A11A3_05639 [Alcanivorax hongdengensis A-11-3]|uniref:Uncharacterized protein n=1 Tax=Alcanivorax hongdengensis A-11-3 TaxID=1177179 RepID=L0WH32_9GAMM|nr:PA1571 family protein [Alcanivorax hongdengensis]EKF75150.1 hypothetical protein A11A3_05639 [Alcanivorax hongdengensis A-11-3]